MRPERPGQEPAHDRSRDEPRQEPELTADLPPREQESGKVKGGVIAPCDRSVR